MLKSDINPALVMLMMLMHRSERVSCLAAGVCGRGGAGDHHECFGRQLLPVLLERRTPGLQAEPRSTLQILMLNKEFEAAVGLVSCLSTRRRCRLFSSFCPLNSCRYKSLE